MPRGFDGVDDVIVQNGGATTALTGAFTIAVIAKRNETTVGRIVSLDTSGGVNRAGFGITASGGGTANQLFLTTTTTVRPAMTLVNADLFAYVAVDKAAGTVTPRFHRRTFPTGVMTHANGGATIANATGTGAGGFVRVGTGPAAAEPFTGDVGLVAIWSRQLSDLEHELASTGPMGLLATGPIFFMPLDQEAGTNSIDWFGATNNALTGTFVGVTPVPGWSYNRRLYLPRIISVTTVPGALVGTFAFAATVAGTPRRFGVTLGSFAFAATILGTPRRFGTTLGSFGFAATVLGAPKKLGTALGSFGFSATVAGTPKKMGSATAGFGFQATVAGTPKVLAQAAGSFGFAATVTGKRTVLAAATGAFGFTATANGTVTGTVYGAATGAFDFSAVIAGTPRRFGIAAGNYAFVGTVTGKRQVLGAAQGPFAFTATAAGTVASAANTTRSHAFIL